MSLITALLFTDVCGHELNSKTDDGFSRVPDGLMTMKMMHKRVTVTSWVIRRLLEMMVMSQLRAYYAGHDDEDDA